jgi:hypothetical protein
MRDFMAKQWREDKKMKSLERAETTKAIWRVLGIGLVLVCLLVPLSVLAQQAPLSTIPGVPNVVNPKETDLQRQTHFLTFIGSYKPESAATSKAYYAAIDPGSTKPTFADWLVNAGFIGNKLQWHAFGEQTVITTQPGCSGTGTCTYGDNIVNADSHAILVNAADLGFVRNQFIRCVPSCTAKNPKIYTYLENYPVAPFATSSGFPFSSGYATPDEATAAIHSALKRPLGDNHGSGVCPGGPASDGCLERIADVAFEWVPPANNPTSSTRFGTLYAYQFFHNPISGEITETVNFAPELVGTGKVIDFTNLGNPSTYITIADGDKFAPNLDFVGFKEHPGVCLICHGGKPAKLTSTGAYPSGGNINQFRFLPLDVKNLMFANVKFGDILENGGDFTLAGQQLQLKAYNLQVLLTVPTSKESDGTGAKRVAALREVITGWYSPGTDNYSNDTSMTGNVQKSDWIPIGWRDINHGGTAPVGTEDLYKEVVGPSCRSCHFNREISLDFGTYANFHQGSDLPAIGLIAQCKQGKPDKGAKFMPLALITFERFWQTQSSTQHLGDGTPLTAEVDRLARDFGYSSVAGYCATNP